MQNDTLKRQKDRQRESEMAVYVGFVTHYLYLKCVQSLAVMENIIKDIIYINHRL